MNQGLVINTHELSRMFGSVYAVKGLTLQVQQGEIFGFLGPNGAGKTTTIKMLCGLLDPSSGQAQVVGYDVLRERDLIKRKTGYMAQHFSLYPDLTAEENFRFFAGIYDIYGKEQQLRMQELFSALDLANHTRKQAGQLSGGLKQRLALACALVHRPQLVFLDEPTAGVDPTQRQRLWDLLYVFCQQGVSFFVTTHYLDEAERCHHVGFMMDGQMIAHGTPQVLREQLLGRMLSIHVDKPMQAIVALRQNQFIAHATLYGHEIRLFFKDIVQWQTMRPLIENVCQKASAKLLDCDTHTPTLEDLFMFYTVSWSQI